MTAQAFISFSGIDIKSTEKIVEFAPKSIYNIYTHDFRDGVTLLEEMKTLVRSCSVFVFFASKSSIDSVWCKYEIDLAEIEKIRRGIKIYVFPLEEGLKVRHLPDWMQDYWVSVNSSRINVLRRRFMSLLEDSILEDRFFGVDRRVEEIKKDQLMHISQFKVAPNIWFISGAEGVGRQTTCRYFIRSIYRNDRYSLGPVIELPDPASLESLYMRLQEDYRGEINSTDYEREVDAFRSIEIGEKVRLCALMIEKICEEDESVYIRCRSGFFDDDGEIVDWGMRLLEICAKMSKVRLVIISNRQPRLKDLSKNRNVLHSHLEELSNSEVDALVQAITLSMEGVALTPSPQAKISIGGHPVLARHYAYSLARYGSSAEERAFLDTIYEQRNILSEFLDYHSLRESEKSILAILSWLPSIESFRLDYICESLKINDYKETIEELILSSLIVFRSGFYSISNPVRLVFRQLHGQGDPRVVDEVGKILEDAFDNDGNLKIDLVETISFLYNLDGKRVPPKIQRMVSPSSMLETARALYRSGRDKPGNEEYERCVLLCEAALQATDEKLIRADLMSVQARSYMRMKNFDEAEKIIRIIEISSNRQSLVLRAQYYRFQRKYNEAIPLYRSAIKSGLNDDAVIHELCICLRETGKFEDVSETLASYEKRVKSNVYLLDMRASLEIGAGRYHDAENTIDLMSNLPDKGEFAARKRAILVCKKSRNYDEAIRIIGEAIDRVAERHSFFLADLYATRCMMHSKVNNVHEAKQDFMLAKSLHRHSEFISDRLGIYVLMAEGKNLEAKNQYDRMSNKTRLDKSLLREILFNLSRDNSLLLSEKLSYEKQLSQYVVDKNGFTEFDFFR